MRVKLVNPAFIVKTNVNPEFIVKSGTTPRAEIDTSFLETLANYRKILLKKAKKVCVQDSNGIEKQALIISTKKNTKYMEMDGQILGVMTYSYTKAPIKGDNYPDSYKNKPYLFINSIYSNKQYKNVGTELIKDAVLESKKKGCKGRVCLNTSTTRPKLGSPVPFYHKFGFEASTKEAQQKISEAIAKKQTLPPECEAVTMFLPMNVVNEIL